MIAVLCGIGAQKILTSTSKDLVGLEILYQRSVFQTKFNSQRKELLPIRKHSRPSRKLAPVVAYTEHSYSP